MVDQVEDQEEERYVMVKDQVTVMLVEDTMIPSCPLKDTTTPSCPVKDTMLVEDINIMAREGNVPPWTCTMLVEDSMVKDIMSRDGKMPPWILSAGRRG